MNGGGEAPVLLTSRQTTTTTALLAEAATRRGIAVRTLGRSDALDASGAAVHWYGGPLAADRIARPLGLGLLEPPDDWLAGLPEEFSGRRVELTR